MKSVFRGSENVLQGLLQTLRHFQAELNSEIKPLDSYFKDKF